jgi:hypothetical protein
VIAFAVASLAWAKNKPRPLVGAPLMPLRAVVTANHERLSNCVFSKQPIPPNASYDTPLARAFGDGDPMYARCYLPDPAGSNKAGELSDILYLDGKRWWTQVYDQAIPPEALERPIALGEILRSVRDAIPKGDHLVRIEGFLTRGKRAVRLYRGEFRYQR